MQISKINYLLLLDELCESLVQKTLKKLFLKKNLLKFEKKKINICVREELSSK